MAVTSALNFYDLVSEQRWVECLQRKVIRLGKISVMLVLCHGKQIVHRILSRKYISE